MVGYKTEALAKSYNKDVSYDETFKLEDGSYAVKRNLPCGYAMLFVPERSGGILSIVRIGKMWKYTSRNKEYENA